MKSKDISTCRKVILEIIKELKLKEKLSKNPDDILKLTEEQLMLKKILRIIKN